MATIKSALSLYDGMSGPLKNIHTALNIVLNSFEAVQDASGNVIDSSAIQEAREELARAGSQLDQMEQNIREAEQAQDQFNGSVREGANAADSLGNKLKGVLATVISIAGVKSALGWAQENMKLADTQRNAENQLKAVLANMGVEDIEIPVTVDTGDAVKTLNNLENNLEALNSPQVTVDTSNAINALNRFSRVSNRLDGSAIDTALNLDNGEAMQAAMEYDDWANRTDGNTIQNTLVLNGPDQPGNLEATLALNTGGAVAAYDDFINTVDGNTITANVAVDNSQAISAYDAITAKASEIQGRGIYGDEAMIAGAAEFATYFSDAEAIMSMMDTLSNYAMGMTGGGAIDATAMVDYATNLGKIMTGAYDAMTKKGFEFTDAQKAVIEGTATHTQYVEALGEDYQSMSEDMRAATVINSIIAESWDGLYEAMSNTPEGKIIQFNNTLGDMREVLGNRIYPAVLQFFDAFTTRFPQIEQLLTWFSDGLSTLILVLTWVATAALDVASVFADNWGWIGPIILGIAGALTVYHGAQLAANAVGLISKGVHIATAAAQMIQAAATGTLTATTAGAIAAQNGLNAALYACPIMWIVILVIALIAAFYAAVAAVNKFAGTSVSATGVICGAFMAALAFIGNIFVALWNIAVDVFVLIYNLVASVANFIGNVFTDPVGAVARLFFDLADTVLGVLQTLAGAIDAIFGSDLSGAVQGWRDSLGGWVEDTFGKGEEVMAKMNADDLKLGRFEYGAAYDLGYNFGEGIEDTVSGMFKMPTLDEMGFDDFGNNLEGIYGNTGDTAANTAATADAIEYTDEDLKYLRDIAEREAINRYTTAQITVEQHNENHISKDTDLDGIMEAWTADFAEKLDISGEGV